jgi:hypothetical protein
MLYRCLIQREAYWIRDDPDAFRHADVGEFENALDEFTKKIAKEIVEIKDTKPIDIYKRVRRHLFVLSLWNLKSGSTFIVQVPDSLAAVLRYLRNFIDKHDEMWKEEATQFIYAVKHMSDINVRKRYVSWRREFSKRYYAIFGYYPEDIDYGSRERLEYMQIGELPPVKVGDQLIQIVFAVAGAIFYNVVTTWGAQQGAQFPAGGKYRPKREHARDRRGKKESRFPPTTATTHMSDLVDGLATMITMAMKMADEDEQKASKPSAYEQLTLECIISGLVAL